MTNPFAISATSPSGPSPVFDEKMRPLAIDAKRLARLLSLSVRTVRTMDSAGKLPRPVKLNGRAVRWVLDGPKGIRAWLAAGASNRTEFAARVNAEKRLPENGKLRKE